MQRFFLRPFPVVMTGQLVRNTVSVLERCRALGMPVAYTMQPGGMNRRERGLLADFWGAGMDTTPAHRDVPGPQAPNAADGVFTKWRYSAFFLGGLLARLIGASRESMVEAWVASESRRLAFRRRRRAVVRSQTCWSGCWRAAFN
ncbi:isochorismatase family protein, partial [Actinophytocola sp.]|uniref:isochorismatase family protein n=1 Tax=Actinophytocola sp. TaxID=1872138 RepID=UPI00389A9D24